MDMNELAQQYYLDSHHVKDTVTHTSPGIAGDCQGTWRTVRMLQGTNGGSVVQIQHLVVSTYGQPGCPPAIMRAVKRLVWCREDSDVDDRPMIRRGIVCMALANRSDTIAVVRMLGWYQDEKFIYIAMEYHPLGNLGTFVLSSPPQSEAWARDVIKAILGVLAELTTSQLTHRNITPSNILIASTLPIRVKLGDFHNAKWLTEGPRTRYGTLPYVAPEMCGRTDEDGYDTKVDMWALGIILHEILTKLHPFREPGRPRFSELQYQRYLLHDRPVVLDGLQGKASVHAMSFVACMLMRDPGLRPTPAEALCAPWFRHPILPI